MGDADFNFQLPVDRIGPYQPEAIVSPTAGSGYYTDIQEAIDYVESLGSGSVGVKAGTYTLTEPLVISKPVSLLGNGIGATIIILDDAVDDNILNIYNSGVNTGQKLNIFNMTLDGNKDNQSSGNGVYLEESNRAIIDCVEVKNIYNVCIYDVGSFGTRVINSFLSYGSHGVYGYPATDPVDGLKVLNTRISNMSDTGIWSNGLVSNLNGNHVYANNIFAEIGTGSGDAVIKLSYSTKVLMTGIVLKTSYSPGWIRNCSRVLWADSSFNTITAGFDLSGNTYSYWRDIIDAAGNISNGTL